MVNRRWMYVVAISITVLATSWKPYLASAADTGTDNLKSLQKEIEHSLMSPCCWSMTVDQHGSPAASKVRTEIAEFLKQGKSKEEILDYFVAQPQYGERILAAPSQKTFLGKLAYWLIPLAFLVGLIIAGKTIKSLARKSSPTQTAGTSTAPGSDKKALSQWDDRIEKELRDFET